MHDTEFFIDYSPMVEMTTCYSFVRRALKKFMFIPETYHNRQSERHQREAESHRLETSKVPIELRNIDKNASRIKCLNKYKRIRKKQTIRNVPIDMGQQYFHNEANLSLVSLLKEKLAAKEKRKKIKLMQRFSLPALPTILRKFSISEMLLKEEIVCDSAVYEPLEENIDLKTLRKSYSAHEKLDQTSIQFQKSKGILTQRHFNAGRSYSLSELDTLKSVHPPLNGKRALQLYELEAQSSKYQNDNPQTRYEKSTISEEITPNSLSSEGNVSPYRAVRPTTLIPYRRKEVISAEGSESNMTANAFKCHSISPLVTESIRTNDLYLSAGSEDSMVTVIAANHIESEYSASCDESFDDEDDAIAEDSSMVSGEDQDICDLPSLQSCSDTQNVSGALSSMPSTITSKTSTPLELVGVHIYYHLFQYGELESLIENYVSGLTVEKAYFKPDNTWNVIVRKV